jgi:hypothetical protein
MVSPICILGRRFTPENLRQLQGWIDQRPDWSRRALSVALSELWDWRTGQGQLRDMAVRLLLNRLERRGYLQLPARQNRGGRRQARRSKGPTAAAAQPITELLAQLQPLSVRLIGPGHPERARLVDYLLAHHYLGYPHPLGQLHYLVADRSGRDLACLLFGPAAWKCGPRDAFIGWTAAQRQAHLRGVANNSRFLILPWVAVAHLASHVLGLVLRRLPRDWQTHCGQRAVLVESFVEAGRFRGTCYRAGNWLEVGATQGRSRQGQPGVRVPVKRLYLQVLAPNFRRELCL